MDQHQLEWNEKVAAKIIMIKDRIHVKLIGENLGY